MSIKKMRNHMAADHGVSGNFQGSRMMMMHVDGSEFFSSSYEWEFKTNKGIVKAFQCVVTRRAKDDLMRFA
jgi:hypothetical protein